MQLIPATSTHLPELMSWFNSEAELISWAGPGFRFPFNAESFAQVLKLESLSSCLLQADDGQILGFGQYSLQHGHAHLSRLVIHPRFRGYGFIQILLGKLQRQASLTLNTASASLFVFRSNAAAIRAYQQAGFVEQLHPQGELHQLCSYMVRPANAVAS
ncbi:N-acetyltransferase [Alishewanella sp. SMS9]|nr:N-acetyltransferase [Alishewanella sp. SMS9]